MNDNVPRVTITFNNRRHNVPSGLSITNALELVGYHLTRGVGCRAGFCGACAIVYRIRGKYELKGALACQTLVEDGMDIARVMYFPTNKAVYDIEATVQPGTQTLKLYPELTTCIRCNACTHSCPVGLKVMDFVSDLISDNLEQAANLSFNCISCQLCAACCPVGISPANAALYGRRVFAKFRTPRSSQLRTRLEEIATGIYEQPLRDLEKLNKADLHNLYERRQIRLKR